VGGSGVEGVLRRARRSGRGANDGGVTAATSSQLLCVL